MSVQFSASVTPYDSSTSTLQGFATLFVKIDDAFTIALNGFRIMQTKDGKRIFVVPPATKSNKTDDNGKNIWFDDIRFLEPKAEGAFKGEWEERAYNEILKAYGEAVGDNERTAAAQAHTEQPTPNRNNPVNPMAQSSGW